MAVFCGYFYAWRSLASGNCDVAEEHTEHNGMLQGIFHFSDFNRSKDLIKIQKEQDLF